MTVSRPKITAVCVFLLMAVSPPSWSFKDYGLDLDSCEPSGLSRLKALINPQEFWFDVVIEITMTLTDWGSDHSACLHVEDRDYEWCVITRRNHYSALKRCLATAEYMERKAYQDSR